MDFEQTQILNAFNEEFSTINTVLGNLRMITNQVKQNPISNSMSNQH